MKNIFSLIFLIFTLTNCSDNKRRDNFFYSRTLCGGLTLESFKISADSKETILGEWLTDSATFRQYIGTTDDAFLSIEAQCIGDDFVLTKRNTSGDLEVKNYRLTDLKKLDNYNK